MQVVNQELWKQAQNFLKDCKGKRVHIIHDFDADGIGGGTLFLHTLTKLGAYATSSTVMGRGMNFTHHELQRIKDTENPERIIINDQDPKSYHAYHTVREMFPDTPIMIADHHFVTEYDDALFVHPRPVYDISGDDMCSAMFIYTLCDAVAEVEEYAWLACLGILGDINTEEFMDFLTHVAEYEEIEMTKDPYESAFGEIADAIDCCSAASEEDLQHYIAALKKAPTLKSALAIGNPRADVREELDAYLKQGLDIAEVIGPVTFIPIEGQFAITGWVSTLISLQYPDRIFAGYRQQTDGYSVNLRFQHATLHMGNINKKITTSLGGRGGGHSAAAGGYIPTENWDTYKELLVEEVRKQLS